MNKKITKEINKLIKELNMDCSVEEFENEVDWYFISKYKELSEDFIREFKNKVKWYNISSNQNLSEDFIREFKNGVYWINISEYKKLSEDFIREFKNEVKWDYISCYQKLSEKFIREFKNKVNWNNISCYQKLSEQFIREFKNKVHWYFISYNQNLSDYSKEFLKEFKSKIDIKLQKEIHKEKTLTQKRIEIKRYAKKHNLKYDKEYLYVFRNHDCNGCGVFNKTISYKKGKYYKDWHCDMRKNEENSFGLGIWPKGNTKVKVKINDWGVAVNKEDGKARVMGFEII